MRDAARLELVEEGAYRRLIDAYYVAEGPLPADRRECYKLAGANKPAERKAVDYVLGKFFDETPDGFRHKRCDLEIAKYLEGEPDRAAKRENEKLRQKRARERRKVLFDQLREFGIVPAFDATTAQLEAELSRVTTDKTSRTRHAPVTRDNTATQTPDTRHQSPDLNSKAKTDTTLTTVPSPTSEPLRPGEVCRAMREAGIASVNPQHADLVALCQGGGTLDEFRDAAAVSLAKGKGFAYAIGVVVGRRKEAASIASLPAAPQSQRRETIHDKRARTAAALGTKDNASKGATYDSTATHID